MMEEIKNSLRKIRPLIILLSSGAVLALVFQAVISQMLPVGTVNIYAIKNEQSANVFNAFDNLKLEAQSAYLFDINKQEVLFALRENDKRPLASIIKLMTALVARDFASESALVTVTIDDLASEGDSGLRSGERWRLGDLLNTMLIISSNDAAHAVARFIGAEGQSIDQLNQDDARIRFIQKMNARARSLGLTQMEFFNESGLDIEGSNPKNGGYGSARDVALLFMELWKKYPTTIEITAMTAARVVSQDNIIHILPNTNGTIGKFSGLIASKTGYTTLAGGNLAIIFDRGINDPVVAVVLGSSYKGRFEDMAKLVSAAGNPVPMEK